MLAENIFEYEPVAVGGGGGGGGGSGGGKKKSRLA